MVFLASIFSTAIVASLLILKFAPVPFFWLGLTWALACWTSIAAARRSWIRAILLNLGIAAAVLTCAEAYFSSHASTPPIWSAGMHVDDQALGWVPAKGARVHAFRAGPAGLFQAPANVIYDVTYTIDSDGLRVAPAWRPDDSAGTVLFFGCSFAFGEGLEDHETLPFQVGSQSGGRHRTFNFAFPGYGPAQMLAAIENGWVQRVVRTTPGHAFYVAMSHHVARVTGQAWYGPTPRYALDPDGSVHRAGTISEPSSPIPLRLGSRIDGQLNKSALWRAMWMRDARITDDDLPLYFAVVRRARDLLVAQYPGIQFRVILWPSVEPVRDRAIYEKLQDGFARMGIPVDLVEDILPGIMTDRSPYALSPVDRHPNALANRLIAKYVLSKIGLQARRANALQPPKPPSEKR